MIHRSPFPDVEIPSSSLHDFVLAKARQRGDRPALVEGVSGRVLTYAQLVDQVRRVAAGLTRRGIGKGSVVAIWSPNFPEYAVVFHAVSRLGAILTTVNPTYTNGELAFQLKDAGASMLITTSALASRAAEAAATLAPAAIDLITLDDGAGVPTLASIAVDEEPPAVDIDPAHDIVVLPYSSGTTGLPKGVMLTHRNVVANLAQVDAIETDEMRSLLGVLPFFHIYGMVVIMNLGLLKGSTIVTLPRFDLETVLRLLQDHAISVAHVVPPVVVALAKHPVVDRYTLTSLKAVFSGAAPLGTELTEAVERRLNIRVRQGYGMTELSPVTHYTVGGRERAGRAGQLVPSTESRIVDANGADAAPGERGELWVRGPQVMKGYLNNPEATASTIDADGWLHTGDVAVVDADGHIEVVDRLKELIKVKGFQVAPAELEAVLLKHPSIADAAVIPVPEEESGEVPKAVVVCRAPLTAAEVMAFVESQVAHYKRLRHVEFVESIPKSPSGKILRRVLVAAERAKAQA